MSKTITIPSDRGSRITVKLNGKVYSYPAGTVQTVPDEVAELFENNEGQEAEKRRAVSPLEAPKKKTGDGGIPAEVDEQGNIYTPEGASISAIHVVGHKVIVPQVEE